MKPILFFVVLCIVGLAPAYKAYEFAGKTCDVATASEKHRGKLGASAEVGAQAVNQPQARTNPNGPSIDDSWGKDFWCKATITDYAIAYFTYCLVLVGIFGMWSAERMTRDAERAHIFPDMKPTWSVANNTVQIVVVPTNSGRSSGILRQVYGQYSLKKPWGLLPYGAGNATNFDQLVHAGKPSVASAGFSSAIVGQQFFSGYIVYMDLFRKRHKTYFCVRVNPPTNLYWVDDSWRTRWLNRFY